MIGYFPDPFKIDPYETDPFGTKCNWSTFYFRPRQLEQLHVIEDTFDEEVPIGPYKMNFIKMIQVIFDPLSFGPGQLLSGSILTFDSQTLSDTSLKVTMNWSNKISCQFCCMFHLCFNQGCLNSQVTFYHFWFTFFGPHFLSDFFFEKVSSIFNFLDKRNSIFLKKDLI